MDKVQLEKVWKQLDGMCEALEQLQEGGINTYDIDLSAVIALKNDVEGMIEQTLREDVIKKHTISKSETAHEHSFDTGVGKYYTIYYSSMGYRFDRVLIFERKQCSCGEYKDFEISRNEFRPRGLFNKDSDAKEYIESIKKKGVEEEFEVNLRTNSHGMNIEKVFRKILIG